MRKWVAGLGLAAVISWGAWYLLSGGRPATQSPAAWIAPAALVRADSDAARRVQSVIDRVQSQPEDAEAWYRLGLAYVASGAEGPARDCMQQAVLRDRMHARARYHLAVIEEQRGEVTLATALCREALSLEPSYVPGWCRLGEWLLEQDELSGARRAFETAQSKPGSPSGRHSANQSGFRAQLGLARVELRDGRPGAAVSILQPLIAAGVSDPLLHQTYATALIRLGRAAELPSAIAAVPAEQPDPWLAESEAFRDNRRSRSNVASQHMVGGNVDAAIAMLEALRREEGDNPAILCNLVAAHRAKGEFRRSAELGEEAVRRFPDSHQPYFNLALTRLAMGTRPDGSIDPQEREHARRLLDASIERNPSAAQPRAVRGRLHLDAGELDAAIEQFRRASIAEPLNANWLLELGRAETAAGRAAAAVETLRRAQSLAGHRSDVTAALATAREAAGGANGLPQPPAAVEGGSR